MPIADGRIADRQDFVRGIRIDLVGDHVIDRELEAHAARGRGRFDRARLVELVVFDERLADRQAARLEERVGHRAADHQPVDFREQILDDLDLVGHLRAAEDRHERPLRRLERVSEVAELLLHQQPGRRARHVMRDPFD